MAFLKPKNNLSSIKEEKNGCQGIDPDLIGEPRPGHGVKAGDVLHAVQKKVCHIWRQGFKLFFLC
jgi:hypothetical protein